MKTGITTKTSPESPGSKTTQAVAYVNPMQLLASKPPIQRKGEMPPKPEEEEKTPVQAKRPALWQQAPVQMNEGVLQARWKKKPGPQNILIYSNLLETEGIVWYYDLDTELMWCDFSEANPHARTLAQYKGAKMAYEEWEKIWGTNDWPTLSEEGGEKESISSICKGMGFNYLAHFTDNIGKIGPSGGLKTPAKTGVHNFDFKEYNNKHRIYTGLVKSSNLGSLKQYGSVVLLFDLTLLDQRPDYFYTPGFGGVYNENSARPGVSKEQWIRALTLGGDKHEIIFTQPIDFTKDAPVIGVALHVSKEISQSVLSSQIHFLKYYYKVEPQVIVE